MFFEIKDLELHPIEFSEKFEPGALDLGMGYRQVTPIESGGRAELVEERLEAEDGAGTLLAFDVGHAPGDKAQR